jgi:hypothetical protein
VAEKSSEMSTIQFPEPCERSDRDVATHE